MKKILSSMVGASLFLLIGAGCAQPATPPAEPAAPPAETSDVTTPSETPAEEENQTTELTLSAEALGGNRVKFTWELPSGTEEPASFRLVRGPKENPASPGNYYYQLLGSKRETTWISLPLGRQNFRICVFKDNKCEMYSNNVEVDVK